MVGVGSICLPYSVRAFKVSHTWRAHLSFSNFERAKVVLLLSLRTGSVIFEFKCSNLFFEANCMWSRTVREKKKKTRNLGPSVCQLSPSPRARLSYIGR